LAGRALVLGAGGVTGIAWEIGVLAGLAEAGIELGSADLVVGSSAGSVVGALLAAGVDVEALYRGQLKPPTGEVTARLGPAAILRMALAFAWGSETRCLARLGRAALRSNTASEEVRREVIATRLRNADWPKQSRLVVTTIVAETGEFLALDGDEDVPLVDAVAASCAVPFVWPAMTVAGRRCIDGGMRSPTNLDLAAGCDPVVVLAPITQAFRPARRLSAQVASLGAARSAVVVPDAAARAKMGSDMLNPVFRPAAALAGREQARRVAPRVAAVWGDQA
jgi:NTE family protein